MSGQWETCDACGGTGYAGGFPRRSCDECDGYGRFWDDYSDTGLDVVSDKLVHEALRLDAKDQAERLVVEPLSELRSPEGWDRLDRDAA